MADSGNKELESEVESADCETESDSNISDIEVRKRKASPLDKSNPKSKRRETISESMLAAFADPVFNTMVAPYMSKAMEPSMQGFIDKAVERAVQSTVEGLTRTLTDTLVSSINEIKVSNAKLLQSVSKQHDLIEKQQEIINSQKDQLKNQADKIQSLEDQVNEITKETGSLRLDMNKLEQYGRRNSIRIINMKLDETKDKSETELKEEVANFINDSMFPGSDDKPISPRDIDRCHAAGPKQLLVKFFRYEDKNRVFYAKKKLKKYEGNAFITEDLTYYNHGIVKTLLELKTANKISAFWTRNGFVFFKKCEADSPSRLQSQDDLVTHGLA